MRTAVAAATILLLGLAAATRLDPLPQGLTATYFPDANWTSTPARRGIEHPSTDSIAAAWRGSEPDVFSATWAGSIVAVRGGVYTFATSSDDGSWVYVDGRLVVDNGGRHEAKSAAGTIPLARGVHEIFIRYFQGGGPREFRLLWARDGGQIEEVPPWALWARHVDFRRALVSVALRRALTAAIALWLLLIGAAAAAALRAPLRRAADRVRQDPLRRSLALLVVGSTALNLVGIWWGVPSAWAGDELTPKSVFIALAQHFSAGWFDRYPPLHFYVLTAAYSPWMLLNALGWIHLSDHATVSLLFVLGRLVSVAAGAGTVLAVYACGARVFSRRAGVFAAAAIALVPMFVFYAKTANPEVAYVFWFALSLAFYLRALDTLALRDVVVCFAAAAMAICTKDQAYALFISMPVVLMFRLRAVADRRLWIGGAAAALLFIAVQNIPLNAHGFISHVRDITGPGRNYAMFEPTFGGQLRLAELTLDIDVRSWGWPLFLASAAGFLIAIAGETTRAAAIRLGLVAATYYVAFIALIRYDYDRYLLPIAVVQALFAGLAIDRLLGGAATRQWRIVAAAAVFAYSTLYAATVDALMVNDSRYEAERWLADHAGRDRVVGHVFPLVVLPRMDDFNHADVSSLEYLHRIEPEFFVVNADYARALTTDRPDAAVLAGLRDGTLGYRLAYRHRTPSPWPWLPGAHPDLVGPRDEGPIVSFLRDINPTIEIYERRQP